MNIKKAQMGDFIEVGLDSGRVIEGILVGAEGDALLIIETEAWMELDAVADWSQTHITASKVETVTVR